jgi:hypothetical protein
MAASIFIPSEDGRFEPTEHARGPWDPAALITRAFERLEPGAELPIGRLGFEFLKPIPLAPLELRTEIARKGRRVQELTAELRAGEELVCRASALRIQSVPAGLPSAGQAPGEAMPGPDQGKAVKFGLNKAAGTGLATTGMEMSWLSNPWSVGPGRVWMRLRQPILPDEPATSLVRLVATADFGNGVSAELPFEEYLFINADLTIHLWRAPRGEWIGLDARTLLQDGGTGVAESVLHDEHGPVGRAFQTLVVQPR